MGYVRQMNISISTYFCTSGWISWIHRDKKNNNHLQLLNSLPYNRRLGVNETEMTGKAFF